MRGSARKTFLQMKPPAGTILGLPSNRKRERDTRRVFSQSQKKEILYQQDNKCARCHEKLDPRAIHFHHIKPWSSGGRTITQNGAALCPKCHEILTHKERLKKMDKKRRKRTPTNPIWKGIR